MGALLSLIEAVPPVSDFTTKKRSQQLIHGDDSNPASESGRLPYWQVNIPFEQREQQCPEYLRDIGERNEGMVGTPASQFHYHNWEEVKSMIDTNTINMFRRAPLDHRKYLNYMTYLKRQYGNVQNFVQQERLKWKDLTPVGVPFSNPDDMKIIYNDWPYGIDSRIVHLCVWTKFPLPDDPKTEGKTVTPEYRKLIDDYVDANFRSRVAPENVIWFKNWGSLKSIHSMEHFHVMLFDPDPDFVKEITDGDAPRSTMV